MKSAILGLILASPLALSPAPLRLMARSRVSATGARLPLRLARIWAGASCGPEPLLDCMVRKTRERSGEVRPLSPGAPAPKREQDS